MFELDEHFARSDLLRFEHHGNGIDTDEIYMPRFLALALAYVFLALAFVGLFLPGLPTVPFLLLTAWFAARGSEKLHRWIYGHPKLGKLLADWEDKGQISRKVKIAALLMLIVSWMVMYFRVEDAWMIAGISILLAGIGIYLVTRPEPQ
jgi:uncharacterized membrane protein YbaN (DUF454 family)